MKDGCVIEIDDPELGKIRQVGVTYKLHANPSKPNKPAPKAGEHTAEVLQAIGYDAGAQAGLKQRGII